MPRRSIVASLTVASAILLVIACSGGPGSLGTFGDDGLEGQGQSTSSTSSSGQASSTSTSSSSTTSSSGSTTSSTSTSSSGSSSGFDAGQRFACGTAGLTCSGSQYCVQPCCGGAQPKCYALDSGFTCPSGYSYGYCATAGANGCIPNPCTPPPAYCTSSLSGLAAGCTPSSADPRKVNCVCQ